MNRRQLWGFIAIMVVVLAAGGLLWRHHQQTVASIQLQSREATAGKELFAGLCETCHGPGGDGAGGAPILNDGSVLKTYTSPSSLSAFIQTHMPASNPGMLNSQEATDLALYIFELNHQFPPAHG
jgi:mono/diheme cytochrome c family protein